MPVSVTIRFESARARKLLKRIASKYQDLRPALRIAGQIGRASIIRNFEVEGRPERWKPLKPATIKQRIREGSWPGLILTRSGHLRRISAPQVHDDRVVISARRPYAAAQHFGTLDLVGRGSGIPPRPFMMLQDEDWAEIADRWFDVLLK